jgi:hypothetical protein
VSRHSVFIALGVSIFALIFFAPSLQAKNTFKSDDAAPALSFEGKTVKASKVKPGGQVVFFAIGLVPTGWQSDIVRWAQVVTDDDHDGTVAYDAGREIPCKSIWVAAELPNGHFTVSAPPNCHLRQRALDWKSFKKSSKGNLELFLQSRPYLDLLYIDSHGGAWTISAADSYDSDADGESNGVTAVSLSNARSLTGDAPPKDFAPGGIVVAIDLYTMDVVAERIDANSLAQAEVQQ